MNIEVRHAHIDEAPVVAVLVSRLLTELGDAGVDTRALLETTRKLLAAGDLAALLVLVDGRPAGVVTLNQCAAIYAGGRFGEICELYVGPDYRSTGIGRHLIEAAVDYARKAGWTRLEVGAPPVPAWQRSVEFYRANGFDEVGPRSGNVAPLRRCQPGVEFRCACKGVHRYPFTGVSLVRRLEFAAQVSGETGGGIPNPLVPSVVLLLPPRQYASGNDDSRAR